MIRGENATLQFVVRSQYSITDLRVNVSEARNGESSLPAAKTGFVGYVKVGRSRLGLFKRPYSFDFRLLSRSSS